MSNLILSSCMPFQFIYILGFDRIFFIFMYFILCQTLLFKTLVLKVCHAYSVLILYYQFFQTVCFIPLLSQYAPCHTTCPNTSALLPVFLQSHFNCTGLTLRFCCLWAFVDIFQYCIIYITYVKEIFYLRASHSHSSIANIFCIFFVCLYILDCFHNFTQLL